MCGSGEGRYTNTVGGSGQTRVGKGVSTSIPLRSTRQKSILQEEEAAKLIGGRRRKGSGSAPGLPGDAVSDRFLVECKYTARKSISIDLEGLRDLEENALNAGKIPFLVFGQDDGERVKHQWVAVPVYLIGDFINAFNKPKKLKER